MHCDVADPGQLAPTQVEVTSSVEVPEILLPLISASTVVTDVTVMVMSPWVDTSTLSPENV